MLEDSNFKKLSNFNTLKSLSSAWLFGGLSAISGVILLPFILNKLSPEEINVWFLFFLITGISEMVVFGFNITFSRFVSYTIAGIHYHNFNKIKNNTQTKKGLNIQKQLSEIFTLCIITFGAIAFIYLIIGSSFGYLALKKPISFLTDSSVGWNSWVIIIFGNFIRILLYVFPIFLQGMNKMSIYYNILSFQRIAYITMALSVLYFSPSLLSLSIASTLSLIIVSLLFWLVFYLKNKEIKVLKINKDLFYTIWDSAWKSGITKIIAPILQYISGIIFAQFASPFASSSFLLTQRIFDIILQLSDITFNNFLPKIAFLRGNNNFNDLNNLIKKVSLLSFSIFVLGYLIFLFFGENLLLMTRSNVALAPKNIIILFSFAYLLGRLGSNQLNLANQANQVIEHKNILIYAVSYFFFLFLFIKDMSMWVFPTAMIIAQIISLLFIVNRSYKLYNTKFIEAEKMSFIPVYVILLVINLIYFF